MSNTKARDIANALIDAWDSYNGYMRDYMYYVNAMHEVPEEEKLLSWRKLYEHWVNASFKFQQYTKIIREFSNLTTWNAVIEVSYGEIIGFQIPGATSLVYLNAYGSRDDEHALCRYGADNKFLMRIGELPTGTLVFSQKASYQIDASGQPQYVHPKGEPAF